MFDALPRLDLLQKSGWFDRVDWFIVPSVKHDFQKETLRLLGIEDRKIVEGHLHTHIQTDLLLASSYVRFPEHIPQWACNFLRKTFLPAASEEVGEIPFMYISRTDANSRNILNELELIQTLKEFGFKEVQLREYSVAEQARLFAGAKVIVAPHGAGLANLVFCSKGATVVELFPEGYVLPLYYDLASKVGLKYTHIVCEADAKANSVKQGMKLNLLVDLKRLKKKVEGIMETYTASIN
nr:glycosyltransferase family 61 protein [Pontibacter harenae]